jgi:protein TonB
MIAASLALHGAAFAAAARVRPASVPARERIEIEVVSRPAPAPSPRPSPPVGEREKRVVRAPAARPVVSAPSPQPSPAVEPPPALASAPASSPQPSPRRAIPRIGLSLGSTVASGGFAVGIGNTAYGKADEIAADPSSVRPYAGGVVPAARLSSQPRPLELPRIAYPPRARKDGVEGQVALVLRLDARGAVTAVKVVGAPTPELGAAAAEGARRFRFSPALLAGEPVETEIRFTYTFLLE